jgi:hypothetical protein
MLRLLLGSLSCHTAIPSKGSAAIHRVTQSQRAWNGRSGCRPEHCHVKAGSGSSPRLRSGSAASRPSPAGNCWLRGQTLRLTGGLYGTKIHSFDPRLTAVCTAYATPRFLPFFHLPIESASARPGGRLHQDRRIDYAASCVGTLPQVRVTKMHRDSCMYRDAAGPVFQSPISRGSSRWTTPWAAGPRGIPG